jgi:hypothetical protein
MIRTATQQDDGELDVFLALHAHSAMYLRAAIAALFPAGSLFILEGGIALACCSFNARLPDMVQIGNVWPRSPCAAG